MTRARELHRSEPDVGLHFRCTVVDAEAQESLYLFGAADELALSEGTLRSSARIRGSPR
jgi:hypothetical protein